MCCVTRQRGCTHYWICSQDVLYDTTTWVHTPLNMQPGCAVWHDNVGAHTTEYAAPLPLLTNRKTIFFALNTRYEKTSRTATLDLSCKITFVQSHDRVRHATLFCVTCSPSFDAKRTYLTQQCPNFLRVYYVTNRIKFNSYCRTPSCYYSILLFHCLKLSMRIETLYTRIIIRI
jgi:hypothetical protein